MFNNNAALFICSETPIQKRLHWSFKTGEQSWLSRWEILCRVQWSTEHMYVTSKNKTRQPSANTGNKCNTCSIWSIWLMWLLQNQKKNTMSFNTFFKMDQGAPPLIPWFCPSLPTTIASSGRSVWETPLAKCLVGKKQDTNLSGFKSYAKTKEIYRYNIFDAYNSL